MKFSNEERVKRAMCLFMNWYVLNTITLSVYGEHACISVLYLFFVCFIRNTTSSLYSAWQRVDNKYLLNEMNFYKQYTLVGVCCTQIFTVANCPYLAKCLHWKLSFVSINLPWHWPNHTMNLLVCGIFFLLQRNNLTNINENSSFFVCF